MKIKNPVQTNYSVNGKNEHSHITPGQLHLIIKRKETEVRSQTKTSPERKDIPNICDICKMKSEDQSKYVLQ